MNRTIEFYRKGEFHRKTIFLIQKSPLNALQLSRKPELGPSPKLSTKIPVSSGINQRNISHLHMKLHLTNLSKRTKRKTSFKDYQMFQCMQSVPLSGGVCTTFQVDFVCPFLYIFVVFFVC